MPDPKMLKARRAEAQKERDSFQPLLDEAFKYAIPFRRSARTERSTRGERRIDDVFDHTAIDSAFRFAGKLQQDLFPAGQENFQLEPGPIITDQAQRDQLTAELAPIQKVSQAFFDDGNWDTAFHEMALELSAGTGAILMNPSDDPALLWEPMSASIDELLIETGANGAVTGIFWTRKLSYRELFETWPEGTFSERLKQGRRDKEGDTVEVKTDTVYVRPGKGAPRYWAMTTWVYDDETPIFETQSRTCPWLVPRYFRVPGESYGRGLVMLAMPSIKTTNTTARLLLMAAAIAMMGIYTARDDGVFNPDLSPIEPGVFWKVQSNAGGALGPSVARFPDPRVDLQGMILKDMQSGIKATMLDQALPVDGAAVKSATEILERVKRAASDQNGAFGRLINEVVVPAVQRTIELAYNKGLIRTQLPLSQLLVRVKVKSPLAQAREADRLQKIIQWLEMVIAIMGATGTPGGVALVAKVPEILADAGHSMGVDPQYILTADERRQAEQQAAQVNAATKLTDALNQHPIGTGAAP